MAQKLLKVKQVADFLGVSTRTVFSWIAQGKIKAVKIGNRITRIPDGELSKVVTLHEASSMDYENIDREPETEQSGYMGEDE